MVSLSERMRTFILGAGASAHAGYPLATDLWGALEEWVEGTPDPEPKFVDAVQTTKAGFDVSLPFEQVFSDLDAEIDRLAALSPAQPRESPKKHTLIILRDVLTLMVPGLFNSIRSRPARLYATFASEVVQRGDTVITFN